VFSAASWLFSLLLVPSHVLAWTSIAAAILLLSGQMSAGRILAAVSAGLFFLIGVFPLGVLLIRPLEARYPRPPWPQHVDGILILSGGLDPAVLAARKAPAAECSEQRIVSGFALARHYPNARVIFSGGSGLGPGHRPETEVARYLFAELGLDPARLTLEGRSRNTWENLAFSHAVARPRAGQVWLLATSAVHLPRAMEAADAMHWKMVPWATDYQTMPDGLPGFFDVPQNLSLADSGLHEWIGMLAYRLRG
jgi:uncharacterized SAM-binding protein YcdF (DUF218 family)